MSFGIERSAGLVCLVAMLGGLASAAAGCGGGSATPPIVYVTPSPGPSGSALPGPSGSAGSSGSGAPDSPEASVSGSPSPTPAPAAATVTSAKVSRTGSTGSCQNWKVTIQKPVVSGLAADAAAAMNAAIDARVQAAIDAFVTEMGYGGGGAGPCTLTGGFSVALSSTTLLSIRLTYQQYTGGAGASTIAGGISFTTFGSPIALADLFTSASAGAARLSTESRTRLLALLGKDGVDAGWIDPGTTPVMSSFDSAWVFTAAGLELTFQEITVAPHALGTPRIVIPWSALASVIDPNGPAGQFV